MVFRANFDSPWVNQVCGYNFDFKFAHRCVRCAPKCRAHARTKPPTLLQNTWETPSGSALAASVGPTLPNFLKRYNAIERFSFHSGPIAFWASKMQPRARTKPALLFENTWKAPARCQTQLRGRSVVLGFLIAICIKNTPLTNL